MLYATPRFHTTICFEQLKRNSTKEEKAIYFLKFMKTYIKRICAAVMHYVSLQERASLPSVQQKKITMVLM